MTHRLSFIAISTLGILACGQPRMLHRSDGGIDHTGTDTPADEQSPPDVAGERADTGAADAGSDRPDIAPGPDGSMGGASGTGGAGGVDAGRDVSGTGGSTGVGGNLAGTGGAGGAICSPVCTPTSFCEAGVCKSRITEYPLGPGVAPRAIASGPDGSLWVSETDSAGNSLPGGRIGQITVGGAFQDFVVLTGAGIPTGTTALVAGLTAGMDGNVWFDIAASTGRAYIGSISPNGSVTAYLFSQSAPQLGGVAVAPDGNIWAAVLNATPQSGSNTIEVSTPNGVISEKTMPTFDGTFGIARGPDGNMWVTERMFKFARVTIAGVVTEFVATAIPINIKSGADGNLWFTESQAIGRSTVGGTVVEFPIATPNAGAWDITRGPDGNMWFTETGANKIGRITPSGAIDEFTVPSSPYGITAGSDGNIWFTEPSAGRVARFIAP